MLLNYCISEVMCYYVDIKFSFGGLQMKKIFSALLVLILVFALVACASGKTGTTSSPSAQPSESASAAASPSTAASPSAAATTTAADDDWAYIKEKGELVIGITEYEPMNYYDKDKKLIGFDTEFAEAACAKLGLKAKFVVINWDSKEIELKSKNIDCIWNGLTISEERKENMAFTDSYLLNRQVVVVRSKDAAKYTDAASLKDANVVAESGSAGEVAAAADLKDAKYTAVDSQANALLEIKAGTADAAVIDYTMAKSMTGAGTDYADLQIVSTITMQGEEYGIGFRLNSTAVDQLNGVIADFQKDGTFKNLAEKYKVTDLLIAK
jgi:polar amino acid transport system substrate-binding protein